MFIKIVWKIQQSVAFAVKQANLMPVLIPIKQAGRDKGVSKNCKFPKV